MGTTASLPARAGKGKARSDEIEKVLGGEKAGGKVVKVLVLGSPGSGKTTLVKQMKIAHQGALSEVERAVYTAAVRRSAIEAARGAVRVVREAGVHCAVGGEGVMEAIWAYGGDGSGKEGIPSDVGEAAARMWEDTGVREAVRGQGGELGEQAEYFLAEIRRISAIGYVPTEADVLKVRHRGMGIEETVFEVEPSIRSTFTRIQMFDISVQRGDPRKWMHCFENVDSMIFCVALSEYDELVVEEKKSHNRLAESRLLFESVVTSRWFSRTSVTLFLNKIDLFRDKLEKVPLDRYFPEYSGGPDALVAAKYIQGKFLGGIPSDNIFPHVTQVTDTSNMKIVYSSVKQAILTNGLKATGCIH